MNDKQAKKLRGMAVIFHKAQPPNMPNKQSLEEIYSNLKKQHLNRNNVNRTTTRTSA